MEDDKLDFYFERKPAALDIKALLEAFVCEYCGGRNGYDDGESQRLTCNDCYAQSQILTQTQETTMEYDDVMNVATKTRGGGIRQASTLITGPRKKPGRQPLEELDQSKPLPDLSLCILGYQSVLKNGTIRWGVY